MSSRTPFPKVFWVANSIEILERIAYYGIYMSFGLYMAHLGYSDTKTGVVQGLFLLFSYLLPIFSGTFADKYGFKKVLIFAYAIYLPSILLLLITKSYSGIILSMLCVGFAAGIFKPLISGTIRVVTDKTNKTLGFGIFYQMVNIGGLLGPIISGWLRIISWNYAFIISALWIGIMLIITLLFYKEPKREIGNQTLKNKFIELGIALSDKKFVLFLVLLGFFFWLPLWGFFNLIIKYIAQNLDTAGLYCSIKYIFGSFIADLNFISYSDNSGTKHILAEPFGNSGLYIICFQVIISSICQRYKAIPSFLTGLFIVAIGYIILALAKISDPSFLFLGVFLFAIGEMMASPRIQEYIIWLAPKEKAGLYMGSNFLATAIGGLLSGLIYSPLYGFYQSINHPEYIWVTLALHIVVGILAIYWFTKVMGEFTEREI